MGCSDSGTWYYSTPETNTATNGAQGIDLTFLGPALRGAKAPRIDRMRLKITYSGTVAAGDVARGDLQYAMLSSVSLRDQFGSRIENFSGTELYHVSKYCYGVRAQAPLAVTGGGAGATVTAREIYLELPFGDLVKAARPQDWRVDARHFYNGQLTVGVTIGALGFTTNTLTTTSVTIQLWAHVIDEGKDTAGPRLVLRKQTFNSNQQDFKITKDGLLYFPLMYVGDANSNLATRTTWAGSGAQNFTSELLGLRVVPDDQLINDYQWASPDFLGTSSPGTYVSEDPVIIGTILPLDNPRWDAPVLAEQPIASVLDILSDLAFASFPAGAEMLFGIVEKRPDGACGSDAQPVAAIRANGKLDPIGVVPEVMQRLVPVVVTRAA